jgi:hypothetical protein
MTLMFLRISLIGRLGELRGRTLSLSLSFYSSTYVSCSALSEIRAISNRSRVSFFDPFAAWRTG